MQRTDFSQMNCSIARTLAVAGEPWSPLVIRNVFVGMSRFDDIQRDLGISRKVLAERLATLVDAGLLERRPYQSDPVRHDYVPTERGRDLFGVLAAMNTWGDRWLGGDDGVPVTLRHETCGHDVRARVVCAACGEDLAAADVTARPGPGYPARLLETPDVRRCFGLPAPQSAGGGS